MGTQKTQYFTKKNSKLIFTILALVILVLAIVVASPYINVIILSVIIAYIVQPIYKFLTKKLKTKKVSASLLSTALIVLLSLILGSILIVAIINIAGLVLEQINNFSIGKSETTTYFKEGITWINTQATRLNLPISITLDKIVNTLTSSLSTFINQILNTASSISSFSVDAFFNLMIFYGLTFLIIPNFENIVTFIKKVSPFEKEITDLYIDRTLDTAKSMVWGMLIISIVQGLVAGLILLILGTPYKLLIMVLVALFSFIPLLGTAMVTLPVAGIYLLAGQYVKGIVLAIFQLLVIGTIDNVIRAKLIPNDTRMPIFVSFIAIFGGLSIWGIWGLIYGPVIFILLLTTIEIIRKYYLPSK